GATGWSPSELFGGRRSVVDRRSSKERRAKSKAERAKGREMEHGSGSGELTRNFEPGTLNRAEGDQLKEAQHVPLAQLARNTEYELILTFILLFVVASIVRWVIGSSLICRSIPQIHG